MQLTVQHEAAIDYAETARLATEAFASPDVSFSPERLRWLYDVSFSHGTTVLSLFAGAQKAGQVALVHQAVRVEGRAQRAVMLSDLFILKPFRSRAAITDLYGEVERFCTAQAIRFILAVPNEKATPVNIRYLKLAPFIRMAVRVGLSIPFARSDVASQGLAGLGRDKAAALLDRYVRASDAGLSWTGESLWSRFSDSSRAFAVHASDDVLVISAARVSSHVPHTLIFAILVREGIEATRRDVARVIAAACAWHGRPVFVYAGMNRRIALPGWACPDRLRPSPMTLQIRDFSPESGPVSFDRFELLDFDFA